MAKAKHESIMPQLQAMQEGDVLQLPVPELRYQRRRRSASIRSIVCRFAKKHGHCMMVSLLPDSIEVVMVLEGCEKPSNFAVQA